jgi:hypothetical protein
VKSLNEVYSSLSALRRYEVWFVRLALAAGEGAWWFRYLLMNPGRAGCADNQRGQPVQVWATWFPADGKPQSFIQGFPPENFDVGGRGKNPFYFRIAENAIEENSCRGDLRVDGHTISWQLQYASTFQVTLSNKGWIGFSRTPHSDAIFSGQILLDGRRFEGNPLGFGLQGHNCGYRHRSFWTWAHAYFEGQSPASTLEALQYDMPFGLVFRKAVLWHEGKDYTFRNLQEEIRAGQDFCWRFRARAAAGLELNVSFEAADSSTHHVPYLKTDCSGAFEVANNSMATAQVEVKHPGGHIERLQTSTGAVLETAGRRLHSAD